MFVLRFGASRGAAGASGGAGAAGRGGGGLCFTPRGGQARENVPLVFGPCKDRKDVFKMTSSGALASVAFSGYYIGLSGGRLVMFRSARRSARFKFTGGKIMVKSGGGRYMYVQSQGGARASMGMQIMARSTTYRSYMKFSCMSKYIITSSITVFTTDTFVFTSNWVFSCYRGEFKRNERSWISYEHEENHANIWSIWG